MPPDEPAARRSPRASSGPEHCAVPDCSGEAVRSLSIAEAKKGLPNLPDSGHRAHLCREHYRTWKKATKKDRELQRLGW